MTPPAAANAQPKALSVSQMLHLMRLEADRARQHGYPITCLMIGLDGFKEPAEVPIRQQIMPAIFGELKQLTAEGRVRGLGLTKEHLVVAVFPHADPQTIQGLGDELRGRVHALRPSSLPDDRAVTVSVGVGHNLRPGRMSFEILLQEAETGLNLAQSRGGDKCVQWREVESELDLLRQELEAQIQEIESAQAGGSADHSSFEERWGHALIEQIVDVFHAEPDQSPGVVRLTKQIIGLLRSEIDKLLASSTVQEITERQNQIDKLERRVRKLTQSLTTTEAELKRVAAMKAIDVGVASIYRTVQGLSDEDGNAEQKKEMLTVIFEANFALQKSKAAEGR